MKTTDERPLERIRRVRHEISEAHGHDPRRLVKYYMELQELHRNRLIETVAPEQDAHAKGHNPPVQPPGDKAARG